MKGCLVETQKNHILHLEYKVFESIRVGHKKPNTPADNRPPKSSGFFLAFSEVV